MNKGRLEAVYVLVAIVWFTPDRRIEKVLL